MELKRMPTTITLKNVPDDLHHRLKEAAASHRRSINNEAIVCLETVLFANQPPAEERLQRIQKLRRELGDQRFRAEDIDTFKREGRP